jgi:hypothetical protein
LDKHSGSDFGNAKPPLADGSDDVENSDDEKQDCKEQPEEQFRGYQFAHEVELQYEQNRQDKQHSLAKVCVLSDPVDERFEL